MPFLQFTFSYVYLHRNVSLQTTQSFLWAAETHKWDDLWWFHDECTDICPDDEKASLKPSVSPQSGQRCLNERATVFIFTHSTCTQFRGVFTSANLRSLAHQSVNDHSVSLSTLEHSPHQTPTLHQPLNSQEPFSNTQAPTSRHHHHHHHLTDMTKLIRIKTTAAHCVVSECLVLWQLTGTQLLLTIPAHARDTHTHSWTCYRKSILMVNPD